MRNTKRRRLAAFTMEDIAAARGQTLAEYWAERTRPETAYEALERKLIENNATMVLPSGERLPKEA